MTALASNPLSGSEAVSTAFDQNPLSAIDDDQEVIIIIRSKTTSAPQRVIHVHRASPKLRALLDGPQASLAPALTGMGAASRATTSNTRRLNPPPLAVN